MQPHEIQIDTAPRFCIEHSDSSNMRFVFNYAITIHNKGKGGAQLLSRYWKITDADGDIQEVHGEGVVGEQPLITPGQHYQYESFCVLRTPIGWMEGHYRMVDEEGAFFEAQIPRFKLEVPGVLQ